LGLLDEFSVHKYLFAPEIGTQGAFVEAIACSKTYKRRPKGLHGSDKFDAFDCISPSKLKNEI
jgi:hypothetical protein